MPTLKHQSAKPDPIKTPKTPLLTGVERKASIDLHGAIEIPRPTAQPVPARFWPQFLATMIIDLSPVSAGMVGGFTGICLPQMRKDPDLNISKEDGSWIASIASLGAIAGCLMAVAMSERLGRRGVLILGAIPMVIGWGSAALAPNLTTLYAARVFQGISMGIQVAPKQVYLSETLSVKYRGFLSSTTSFSSNLGILMIYLFGGLLSWRLVCWMAAIFPLIFIVGIFFMPDTPTWLASQGRIAEAEDALRQLRGEHYDVTDEMAEIMKKQRELNEHDQEHQTGWERAKSNLTILFSRSSLWPLCILFVLFFTHKFSGSPVITNYAADIFRQPNSGIDESTATIISGALRVTLPLVGSFLIRKVKKKPLLIVSGVGMAASLYTAAFYGHIEKKDPDGSIPAGWVPIVAVYCYQVFVIPGFLTVPWVLLGELFPLRTRSTLSCLTACFQYCLYFAAVKSYPLMSDWLTPHGVYWVYGTVTVFGTAFAGFFLPETKGKSLNEIEDGFARQDKPQGRLNPAMVHEDELISSKTSNGYSHHPKAANGTS